MAENTPQRSCDREWWITFLALFLASTLVQAADCATIPDEAPMTVVGEFTNMRFTEEHQYGYELTLWRAGGCLVGFFYRAEGLAGDTPMGELQNVAYDSKNGRLSFESKLRTGNVAFAGEFRAGRVTGIVTPGRDQVTLRPTKAQVDLISGPRTYREWRDYWAPILRRLGPSGAVRRSHPAASHPHVAVAVPVAHPGRGAVGLASAIGRGGPSTPRWSYGFARRAGIGLWRGGSSP